MSREDFGDPFGRDFGGSRDFDDLREQMARKRDEFFNDRGDHGFFSTLPRSSFAGFPSATGSSPSAANPASHHLSGGRHSVAAPGGRPTASFQTRGKEDDSFANKDSIPINVIHEKSNEGHSPAGKHRYGQGPHRNTTDLPAGGHRSPGGPGSPRLERAHSEPPGKFNERRKFAVPSYSTIPESEQLSAQGQPASSGAHNKPSTFHTGHLGHPIKTSASAPSVPESQVGGGGHPQPPPRRSPPPPVRPSTMNLPGSNMNSQPSASQNAVPTGSQIRHIPIHVEGRHEPIFNTHIQGQPEHPRVTIPLPGGPAGQGSGVQRIRSRDSTSGEPASPMPPPRHPIDEPTTPQGPPPGPIPMGYVPTVPSAPSVQAEPTTPQGPPPGPIPMGFLPSNTTQPDGRASPNPAQPSPSPELVHKSSRGGAHNTAHNVSSQKPGGPPVQPEIAPNVKIEQKPNLSANINVNGKNMNNSDEPPPPPVRKSVSKSPSPPKTTASDQQPATEQKQDGKAAEFRIPIRLEGGAAPQGGSRESSRPSSQELPQQTAPAAANTAAPDENEDPIMTKIRKLHSDADDLEPRIKACTDPGSKEKLWLDEQLTTIFLKYDALYVPDGKPEVLKIKKKELLQRLKTLEKILGSL